MDSGNLQKTGIPHKFFMTAYTCVNFVQQRAHRGAEESYQKYTELMKDYLKNDVAPAILKAEGDEKIKVITGNATGKHDPHFFRFQVPIIALQMHVVFKSHHTMHERNSSAAGRVIKYFPSGYVDSLKPWIAVLLLTHRRQVSLPSQFRNGKTPSLMRLKATSSEPF